MGLEVLLIAGAIASLAGGLQAIETSNDQAKAIRREGEEQADIRAKDVKRSLARNTALFAKSGVTLEGSPLFSLEQDAITGAEDVAAIRRTASSKASAVKAQGRAAFLGSIGQAAVIGSGIPKAGAA